MKHPFFYFFPVIIALFQVQGCLKGKDRSSVVVAVINEEAVTYGEFNKELSYLLREAPFGEEKPKAELKADLLNRLIERKLILQEAKNRGIAVTDEELDKRIAKIKMDYPGDTFDKMIVDKFVDYKEWKERLCGDYLVEKTIEQAIGSKLSVEEMEAREFYDAHPDEYKVEEQVRARQIFVRTEEEAREILKRLQRGEDFKTVAAESSLSADREKGGDLGFFSRGQMPPQFDEACFSLPVGKISGVVRSPYGYHIFRVEEKRKGRRLDFNDVRKKIMERIFQEKKEAAFKEWMEEIRKKSRITMNVAPLEEVSKGCGG